MVNKNIPFINIGPGEFIKEDLEVRNWRQEDLAEILGMSIKTVNQLINNKQSITIEMSKLLSKAFGQSPQYWINLDANYRLRLERDEEQMKDTEVKATIYKYMPISEMVNKCWIKPFRNSSELTKRVHDFWNINKLDFTFLDSEELPDFKKSEMFIQYNKYYSLAWFNMAKKSAQIYSAGRYSMDKLRSLSSDLTGYTTEVNGIELFLNELNKTGVKFFILSHLKKTYIDGAAFFDRFNPVIVYSARHNRVDNFWFTIAHEISHILLHFKMKSDYFIDDLDYVSNKLEEESNHYASKLLKAFEIIEYFKTFNKYISEKRVLDCSNELNVSPALIVGILHHHRLLSRRNLNKYKEKVLDMIPGKYLVEESLQIN